MSSEEKSKHQKRLGAKEFSDWFRESSFWELSKKADNINKTINNNFVCYQNYININHTNECELRCPLCAFSRDIGNGYLSSTDEILDNVINAKNNGIFEVHIVGGLHPKVDINYFIEIFDRIKSTDPKIKIQALTAVEIDYLSKKSCISVENVLLKLKNAGLDCMPGGGAEIFSERVRNLCAPLKISGDAWLDIHEIAHELGIPTNATILFDAGETIEEYFNHLEKLRTLQDKTHGFKAIVPLKYHPDNSKYKPENNSTMNIFSRYSATRIFLDNFPHVKVLWLYLGLKTAQMLLYFGVSDFGATGYGEQIVRSAGAKSDSFPDEKRICELITRCGKIPVKTDTLFNIIKGDVYGTFGNPE